MTLQLTLFHTNDMHGRLQAMTRLSNLERRLRTQAEADGRITFLLDGGDAADRRERICSASKGAAFMPIMRAMGYDVQTLGNDLALTYGPQVIKSLAERAGFPILAANLRQADNQLPEGLREYTVFPLPGGLRLGVFGLTASWAGYASFGLHIPDACDQARRLVGQMKNEGIHIVILLSHLGLREDRVIAASVPGIDLIIGGHSHTLLEKGEEHNGVLIAQAGNYCEALGQVELSIDEKNGRVLSRSAQTITVSLEEPSDPFTVSAIDTAEAEIDAYLKQEIGFLQSALTLNHYSECGIGDFAADVLRQRMQADIAIIAAGQFHAGLKQGVITRNDLNAACFSTANPALTLVSGAQILEALERGLDPSIIQDEFGGLRGNPLGIPQISGLQVWYDPNARQKRIWRVLVQEAPLKTDHNYRLAHTDLETYENTYILLNANQPTQFETPTIIGEILQDYFQTHSPVAEPAGNRWIASPKESQSIE